LNRFQDVNSMEIRITTTGRLHLGFMDL